MSQAARIERAQKRRWAEPGSRHDTVVKWLKWGLPAFGLILLLFLLFAPLSSRGDVSFILDKEEVDQAPERMRVEKARYTGEDNDGQMFTIVADQALQETSAVPVVVIDGMAARLELANGPLDVTAERGTYDIDDKRVEVPGGIRVRGPDGYKLDTSGVTVDLGEQRLTSDDRVTGEMRLGEFTAGGLEADLEARTVTLTGRATLKIRQGSVR